MIRIREQTYYVLIILMTFFKLYFSILP